MHTAYITIQTSTFIINTVVNGQKNVQKIAFLLTIKMHAHVVDAHVKYVVDNFVIQ